MKNMSQFGNCGSSKGGFFGLEQRELVWSFFSSRLFFFLGG